MIELETLRRLVQEGKPEQAEPGYIANAEAGDTTSATELGHLILCGFFPHLGAERARALMRQGEAGGSFHARYFLALHALGETAEPIDWPALSRRIVEAAQAHYPPALRALALHWGRHGDAVQQGLSSLLLEHAVARGDGIAMGLLCRRLQRGFLVEPHPARAAAMSAWLNQRGFPFKPPMQSVDLRLLVRGELPPLPSLPMADFSLEESGETPRIEVHCPDPWVALGKDVLDEEQRLSLMLLASQSLKPSITVRDDGQLQRDQMRSSYDADLSYDLEDVTSRLIQRRMMRLIDTPLRHAEPMVVLRYRPGQQYFPHRDYLPPSRIKPVSEGGEGQRRHTVIAYLSPPQEGGETVFPILELSFPITPGDCLLFRNIHEDGALDERTLHAGNPVRMGEKWIATLWVREAPLRKA